MQKQGTQCIRNLEPNADTEEIFQILANLLVNSSLQYFLSL